MVVTGIIGETMDIRSNTNSELGQGLLEYAWLIALIALVIIVSLALFGGAVLNLYNYGVNEIITAFGG